MKLRFLHLEDNGDDVELVRTALARDGVDCDILAAGRHGVMLEGIEGEVVGSTIVGAEDAALFSLDARGLRLAGNTIRAAGNNGILVWRSAPGDDGIARACRRSNSACDK